MSSIEWVNRIRAAEREYHDQCYEQQALFEPGSWLYKPVRTIMELLPLCCEKDGARVLDLGAGVGRNSISIAQYVASRNGAVVAVDVLESAIQGLVSYAGLYGVSHVIHPVKSDIESYLIEENSFDFIVAVSALEHLQSLDCLESKLSEIADGIKPGGVFCIIMGTNISEIVEATGESIDPMFELNLPTDQLQVMLDCAFHGWETIKQHVNHQQYGIQRQDKQVILSCDCLTLAVRKQA